MGLWRGLRRFFGLPVATFSDPSPRPIDQVILEMSGVSGTRISRPAALSVPAVLRGRNMICSISTLPLIQTNGAGAVQRNPLLEQIDRDVANIVTLAQTVEDLLCESVAWWLITEQDLAGFPIHARRVDPSQVSLDPPSGGGANPLPSRLDPRGIPYLYVEGVQTPADLVIRFDSPNPPLLTAGAKAIRRALLLDKAASLYAEDPRPLDFFTPADDAEDVDDEEVDDILAAWRSARKKRATAWVPKAMKYNSVDTPSPQQLQLVELQERAALEIANAIGVDPEDLGISTTSRTYSNIIDRRQDSINDVKSPYMLAITQRLSMGDVTRRGHVVKFDLQDYLKANPVDRATVDKQYFDMKAMTRDEVRAGRGLPPLTDAQRAELEPKPAPVPPVPPTEPVDPAAEVDQIDAVSEEWRQMMTGKRATFSSFEAVTLDVPVRGFAVDRQRRIVEGLILPYGPDKIAYKYGMGFRFRPGSLRWTSVNRVKLLRDHDMSQLLGVATDLTETADGLRARFKVARGPEGDRALSLAEDGVLDGFSVGVDFAEGDMALAEDGVYDVSGADLRETSLTAMPAFDDARLTKVVASRGGNMSPNTAPAAPAQPAAVPETSTPAQPAPAGITLTDEQARMLLTRPGALQALVSTPAPAQQPAQPAGFTLSAEQLDYLIRSGSIGHILGVPGLGQAVPGVQAQEVEQREVVSPVRRAVSASVSEPAPYRFDRRGNLGRGEKFDFSTDLIHGLRDGNGEALERAQGFVREWFEARNGRLEFVNQADAATLNPAIQRSDLYVDQKDFTYPIWDAIAKGTINDATPFVLPKFSSSSGLVGAHVENTEPTPGTFVATSQTITPSPVSGKVEISREAWDQGGNPQLSTLIWNQMLRAWFEALEASAVTLLEGLAPTVLTITTAAADGALEQSLTSQLAPLQYVRGGFRFRDFFLQVDLYKALVAAKDSSGRRLFPNVGAQNSLGTVSDFFADLLVAGLRGRPAWALAATSANSSNSYLFDRNDVSGWATPPLRLTMDNISVAKVHVGIWGYKALACTDLTGVRRLAYDPV